MPAKRDLTGYFKAVDDSGTPSTEDRIREAIDLGLADKCDFDTAEFYFNVVSPLAQEIGYPMHLIARRLDPFFDVESHTAKLKLIKEYTLHNRIAYLKSKIAEDPKKAKTYDNEIKKCETELKIKYNWVKPD